MVAWPIPGKTRNGKTRLRFAGKATSFSRYDGSPVGSKILPCRQCIECRLEKSRQWATRLMHEVSAHPGAIFLTLTYDDNYVPVDGSLNPSHLQTFFKDLRARNAYYGKEKIKYFACGEYGEKRQRPHYHAAIYGSINVRSDDPGLRREEPARSGSPQFSHADIEACWPYGLHRISELNFELAAYMARYVLKKISGASAPDHYGDRRPEFQRQSKGLGKAHVEKWLTDIYPSDHVVLPGRGAFTPPPYYDRVLEKIDPALYERVKKARQEARGQMTDAEWFEHVNESYREGEVRTLVTEQTLIRGGVI